MKNVGSPNIQNGPHEGVQSQEQAKQAFLESLTTSKTLDGGMMMSMSNTPEAPATRLDEYGYDHLGNRTTVYLNKGAMAQETQVYAHNSVNQYSTINSTILGLSLVGSVAYDDNGNLQTDADGYSYTYDYRNRITQIDGVVQFKYDALGRRFYKKDLTTDAETYYIFDDSNRIIAQYVTPQGGAVALDRTFVYGNDLHEVLAMFLPENEGSLEDWQEFLAFCETWLSEPTDVNWDADFDVVDDDIINFKDYAHFTSQWNVPSSKETRYYYLHDVQGSVMGLIGGRLNRPEGREFYTYDVYGTPSGLSAVGNPFMFHGKFVSSTQPLIYSRHYRNYSPSLARWLQFDPINTFDSMNLYEFTRSNPTNYIDPFGLSSIYWTPGGVGFPVEYQKIRVADKSPDSLSRKITELLALRAGRGFGIPFNIYNRFRNDYNLEDELNEMNHVFGGDIERYYVDVLIHNRHTLTDEKWRKISFSPPPPLFREWSPGVPGVDELPSLGFWLGGPHKVSANGCFEAKCCGSKCTIRNINASFEWRDQIDANSFKELKHKPAGKFEKFLEGGIGDVIGDKLLGMSFYITIHWKHTDKSERQVNIESRLQRTFEREQK